MGERAKIKPRGQEVAVLLRQVCFFLNCEIVPLLWPYPLRILFICIEMQLVDSVVLV